MRVDTPSEIFQHATCDMKLKLGSGIVIKSDVINLVNLLECNILNRYRFQKKSCDEVDGVTMKNFNWQMLSLVYVSMWLCQQTEKLTRGIQIAVVKRGQ